MLKRAMDELMGFGGRNGGIVGINDEAHHCYREKPGAPDDNPATGEDRREAERNKEAALHDGRFVMQGAGATGSAVEHGPTAVLALGAIRLVVRSVPGRE